MLKKKKLLVVFLVFLFVFNSVPTAYCCSIAGVIGDSLTTDGRPILWKNRDSWGSTDCWKTYAYYYEAKDSRPYETIDYIGITDPDSKWTIFHRDPKSTSDEVSNEKDKIDDNSKIVIGPGVPITQTFITPWAGANTEGLGLVQTAAHTLENSLSGDQDSIGINNGMLNHLILSSCDTVDDVEQLLRDTNNGWSHDCSDARNTNALIMVFDKYGQMATFEVTGTDFTRDNTVGTDYGTTIGDTIYYNNSNLHTDDKDSTNPISCSGFDWRTNFSKVNYTRNDGFQFFVDNHKTIVSNNEVVNLSAPFSDGIDDREDSTSSVKRWTRVGARMDDSEWSTTNPNLLFDYKYFIQKYVGSYGIPNETPGENNYYETLSRSIGELPTYSPTKSTGWHLNRFVTTFSVVITGSKPSDPDDGNLTTIWVALGEPECTVFIPLFPSTGEVPSILSDMYSSSNAKRHQIYNYTNDDCLGYSDGRNISHDVYLNFLLGSTNNYYGEGGIQQPIFQLEDNAFSSYDSFCNTARTRLSNGTMTMEEIISALTNYQNDIVTMMKTHYTNGTTGSSPLLNPINYLGPPEDPF